MSTSRAKFIDRSEIGVTFLLLLEIAVRFVIDWRHFFRSKRNIADLAIAIITSVIQIPAIKDSHSGRAYAWLSLFQIIRIYRVVLAVPMTRELIVRYRLDTIDRLLIPADDRPWKRQRSSQSYPFRVLAYVFGVDFRSTASPRRDTQRGRWGNLGYFLLHDIQLFPWDVPDTVQ